MCTLREEPFALSRLTRDVENFSAAFSVHREAGQVQGQSRNVTSFILNASLTPTSANIQSLISIHTNTPSIASPSGVWQTTFEPFNT
jgi:hypothetical protein